MAIVQLEELGKLKKYNDPNGIRTRDLPACSISASTNYAIALCSIIVNIIISGRGNSLSLPHNTLYPQG
jgi:hypothetical protein